MALSLMCNLASMTQHVLHSLETKKMNLVSILYDRIHFIFLQFTETLSYFEGHQEYSMLLPPHPERVLITEYNLPPPYAISILRGSLKPIFQLTDDEFN